MKTKLLMLLLFAAALSASCANLNRQPSDMDLALQNAVSEGDHKTLAEHYEAAAQEMRNKADEYKKLLAQYESKSYLYGRQAEDLKAHCQRLIDVYEKAANANMKLANMHRQLS
ncbi:MAG: hypothetical protein ACXWF8_19200 [Methylobacter sp.]